MVRRAQGFNQLHQDAIQISHHILIANPYDTQTARSNKSGVSCLIQNGVMCFSVDLNGEIGRGTIEVHNSVADHVLTAKFPLLQLFGFERLPKSPLRLRWIVAHGPGALTQGLWQDATTPNPLL